MTLDLLIAILLTAAGALVIWALAISVPGSNRQKAAFAIALIAWFSIAVVFGATGVVGAQGFGTTGVGVGVLLPVLAFAWLGPRWPALRNALTGIPIPVFIAVNTVRVAGFFFVILWAEGRLPFTFAQSAGWGDVLAGAFALPVAWMVMRQVSAWRPTAFVWNLFGFADLVVAVTLGTLSAADSPLYLFIESSDSSPMESLPMYIIPGFFVPLFILTHLAVFYRLSRSRSESPT
jgi:hypothetical protein